MVRKVISAGILVVLFTISASGMVRADMVLSVAAQTILGTPSGQPNASNSTYFYGPANWVFSPGSVSWSDQTGSAEALQSSSLTYSGSSLHVTGTGSAYTNTPEASSSSSLWLTFTPSVDSIFHLTGSLAGDMSPGWYPYLAFIKDSQPGSGWYYVYIDYYPGPFDLIGTLYAGQPYRLNVSIWEPWVGPTYWELGKYSYSGSWQIDFSMQPVSAVPEPITMLFLISTLIGLVGLSRKFKN